MVESIDYGKLWDRLKEHALVKTRNNELDADDLVGESIARLLEKKKDGKAIKHQLAYAMKIMDNIHIKSEKRDRLFLEKIKESVEENPDGKVSAKNHYSFDSLYKETLRYDMRKAIAFLRKDLRDVMILYIFKYKTQIEIANIIGISEKTVYNKIKKGEERIMEIIEMMKNTTSSCFERRYLTIGFTGYCGLKADIDRQIVEPLEHDILILTNHEPKDTEEISLKFASSGKNVDAAIMKLRRLGLLKQKTRGRYYSDFYITTIEDYDRSVEQMNEFVIETFPYIEKVLMKLYREHQKHGLLNKFDDERLKIYGVASTSYHLKQLLFDAFGINKVDVYKIRQSDCKVNIDFGFINDVSHLTVPDTFIGGPRPTLDHDFDMYEWDYVYGRTFRADYVDDLPAKERARLLYRLAKKEKIDVIYDQHVESLLQLGFIDKSISGDNKYDVLVPILKENEHQKIEEINLKYANEIKDKLMNNLISMIKSIRFNKDEKKTDSQRYGRFVVLASLSMLYINKMMQKGTIKINEGQNNPICILIQK